MADMEAACKRLDEAVVRIDRQHSPLGCLPLMLAGATGAIVAGVSATSIRWYFSALLSLGGAGLTLLTLMVVRVGSWSRHHPLLDRMYKLRHARQAGDDADDELLELGEAIVRKYLPEVESELLLARLEEARERTALLLGLDDEEREPRGHAGA